MKKAGVLVILLILLSFFVVAKQVETVTTSAQIGSNNIQAELLSPEDKGKDMDDEIVGNSCGTVSPDGRDECCKNKGFSGWDKEDNECDDEDNDDDELDEKKEKELEKKKESEEKSQDKVKNENQVREAVHALLDIENRTGGIGPQVSTIARNFNNGINKSLKAEEKIQKRSKLRRFFSGGDEDAAEVIEEQIEENEADIEELGGLVGDCDCDDETKGIMKEQIMLMLQENERLQELAQSEKKSKGIFGWLWK